MTHRSGWLRVVLTLVVLVALSLGFALTVAWQSLPLEHATITIDGESMSLGGIHGWQALLAIVLATIAVLVAFVIAVLAVAFAVAVAALGVAAALLAVVASLALVVSPALLVVWLFWLLLRPSPRQPPLAA
jgi:hypothetical protein